MPAFRDFYSAYQEQLLSRIRAGSTQTNNVRRSAALAPIDLSDAAQVRWLEAFVFPEAHDDLERLRAARAIAQDDPPHVVHGDAVTSLPVILDSISEAYAPVVFHCTLFSYLDALQRQAMAECLVTVGSRRDLCWLPLEGADLLTGVQPAFEIPSDVAMQNSKFVLAARWWTKAIPKSSVLAQVDARGRSIRGLHNPESSARYRSS